MSSPDLSSPRWWLDRGEEIVASIALVVVVLATTWGVVTRYITAQPAAWAAEASTIGFAWVVFLGSAACIKYKLHPSIDVPMDWLPSPLRLALTWLNHALVLAFCAFMTWFGVRFAIDAWSSPTPVMRAPQTILYGPVAASFALMFVRYIQYVIVGRRSGA